MDVIWPSFRSPYTESEVKKHVTEKAGVYLLWFKLETGKWKCFYVGKADNLRARLLDHLLDDEENECIKNRVTKHICGFEYAKVPKESDRKGIEKFLYDHYSPGCNQTDPGGEPIYVNLP